MPPLNRKFLLETAVRLPDGAGGYNETWTPLGLIWGALVAVSGREAAGAETAVSRMAWRITVRAAPWAAPSRPKPGQRLRDGGRVFVIDAVTEADSAGRFLNCHAREEAIG